MVCPRVVETRQDVTGSVCTAVLDASFVSTAVNLATMGVEILGWRGRPLARGRSVLVVVGRLPRPGTLSAALQAVVHAVGDGPEAVGCTVLLHWGGHGATGRAAVAQAELSGLGWPVTIWEEAPSPVPPFDLVLDVSLIDTVLTVVGKKSVSVVSSSQCLSLFVASCYISSSACVCVSEWEDGRSRFRTCTIRCECSIHLSC